MRNASFVEKWANIEQPKNKPDKRPNTSKPLQPGTAAIYGKEALEVAVQKILEAPDGQKRFTLLKMSRLIGGYVAGGMLAEESAFEALKDAIDARDCGDYEAAYDTIRSGLDYGMQDPITAEKLQQERDQYFQMHNSNTASNRIATPNVETATGESSVQQSPEVSPNLKAILEARQKLQQAKLQKVVFSPPIISREDMGIFFPNTINVIQAKDGMHKSRLAGIIGSSLLRRSDCKKEHLKFTASQFKTYTLLYVDTERNLRDQLPFALQQIQYQAGYQITDNPPNFDFVSLLEFDRENRLNILSEYLNYTRTVYSNHIFIVLDVVTDCIGDFNNVKESLKLIDLMNRLINSYDVTFLCIIHENPGSEKARGNIGTEIINKASTALQLEFVCDRSGDTTDVIKVKHRKCRMSAKPKPFYIQYDKEEGLVLTDPEFTEAPKELCPVPDLVDFLESELVGPRLKDELFPKIIKYFNCGTRTVEDRIKSIIDSGAKLFNQDGKESTLHKDKQGKQVVFELVPLPSEEQ